VVRLRDGRIERVSVNRPAALPPAPAPDGRPA
jgi:hypothetical protein